MPLASGKQLGPYEIRAPLGAGGMGEVYRARDTKLKREVALKVLPQSFVGDAQRMARFEREAQVLAALNHPNIAHIYGVEDTTGVRALVMELVEGQTLAERLGQGPVALEEALVLAKQIAEGLEYAHERGVIHRDLKPANIKVTPEGQVKILDFGLAKALEGDGSAEDISTSPTLTVAATHAGVLLGTAGYMSPEQAKGRVTDRRADIWAYGCVLFEMLTGKAAFDGETITDKLAAVVRDEAGWSQLPEKTPKPIRELLQRCLVKDPKQRLQAIGEARIALEASLTKPGEENRPAGEGVAAGKKRQWIASGVALASTMAALVLGVLYGVRAPEAKHVVRTYIKATPNSSFLFLGSPSGFALSPDGLRSAYVAENADGKAMLWVRPLDSLQAQPLAGTEDAAFPFWSADGRSIGFFAEGKLKRIEAAGGPTLTLCDAPIPRGGTWNQDGVILFAPGVNLPLHRISASGGMATPVTSLDSTKGATTHRWPYFLPDGRHFLFLAGTPFVPKEKSGNGIFVGSLDSKESKLLVQTHAGAAYALGHLLFLRLNTLMAQPFDLNRMELTGEAAPVADPVQEEEVNLHSLFSSSQNGLLAYLEGTGSLNRELIWVDRAGKKVAEVPGADAYMAPRISPDGKRIIYTVASSGYDIWSYDPVRRVKMRLTFGASSGQAYMSPIWSPDGQRIAYSSLRNGKFGTFEKAADGSGSEEDLHQDTEFVKYLNDWSPDGKFIVYQQPVQGINGIWVLTMSGERTTSPLLQSQNTSFSAAFSPDGRWLAYCSSETGPQKVYVTPFPGPGGKWEVSPGGSCYPRWRRDGKELFYLTVDNKIVGVEVKASGSGFEIGAVKTLFESRVFRSLFGGFDVSADGQLFVFPHEMGQPNAAITLVENWDAELKK